MSILEMDIEYKKLKQILHNYRQTPLHKRQNHIAKRIRQKLKLNNLTLMQADKGKTFVVIDKNELRRKINTFLSDNYFTDIKTDQTEKFQKLLRKGLNQCDQIVHKNMIKTLLLHRPVAPRLQVRIKTRKDQYAVRPAVNNMNTATYRTARLLNRKLLEILQLPNTYKVLNSRQLAYDPTTLKLNKHDKCITLDIKDLFTNVPIKETKNITKHILRYNHLTEDTITQYINLLHIILKQNYFSDDSKYYKCNKSVAMESPISNTIVEILLQKYENLFIKHWIESKSITYYSRYVDDIFIMFNTKNATENIITDRLHGCLLSVH